MNLRELAALAYVDRRIARERELIDRALRYLADIIPAELPREVGKVDAESNPQVAEFEVDGITFKVAVNWTEKTSEGSNKGMKFEDLDVTVYARKAGTDSAVSSLADVGALFKNVPLPDPEFEGDPDAIPADAPDTPHS